MHIVNIHTQEKWSAMNKKLQGWMFAIAQPPYIDTKWACYNVDWTGGHELRNPKQTLLAIHEVGSWIVLVFGRLFHLAASK
jgi:hypothetical protein